MQNRRKAFDRLCPNRIAAFPSRLQANKKQDKAEKKGHCLQGGSDFDLQEFRDAVDSFIADQSTHMQSGMGTADFHLPPCDVSVFEQCMPPAMHPGQLLTVRPVHTDQYWRDVADHNQKALGDALVQNNQLHVTLSEKQEEIQSLKEKNDQLKEIADQAQHLASVLDKLMSRQSRGNGQLSPDGLLPRPPVKRSLEEFYPPSSEQSCNQMDEILQEISKKCNITHMGGIYSEAKRPKLYSEEGMDCQEEITTTIKMCGAFHGLQTSTVQASLNLANTDLEEDISFKTSIKDHCTIRTLAFPQGNAFTIRTNGGGYKFRWVPN
ncbi:multicilin isoform X2 [Pseudophryne corroboree]|uniref:multicilin isoform X2 n=1 Tax=Pseudophryne corroboree TaxID=495146 RepID=UPI003081EF8E